MGTKTLSPNGRIVLEAVESGTKGPNLKAYKDGNGIWTIGWGHTGRDVFEGLTISVQLATDLLEKDVKWAEFAVNKYVNHELTQNQFDAMVIFVFNIGATRFVGSSMLRDINSGGTKEQIQHDWMKWDIVNKQKSLGLDNRRAKEIDLFFTPEVTNA